MIIDSIENIENYFNYYKHFEAGAHLIKDLEEFPLGRYEFNGGYLIIQEGVTSSIEDGDFEIHDLYYDVHFIIEGSEFVAWTDSSFLQPSGIYQPEYDKRFYHGDVTNFCCITSGTFYILKESEAHKAVRHIESPLSYKKIVMKLKR